MPMAGRFQKIDRNNVKITLLGFDEVIVDVGHNPQCIERVFQRLRKEYGSRDEANLITVFGCKHSKDYTEANRLLGELSDQIYVVRPEKNKG